MILQFLANKPKEKDEKNLNKAIDKSQFIGATTAWDNRTRGVAPVYLWLSAYA